MKTVNRDRLANLTTAQLEEKIRRTPEKIRIKSDLIKMKIQSLESELKAYVTYRQETSDVCTKLLAAKKSPPLPTGGMISKGNVTKPETARVA